ncbi:MAG: aspartyl protease family protein [Nitrospirota bacterium]|nr:MAG: aspartyl protease family protein [Nitrospirota bacterium]
MRSLAAALSIIIILMFGSLSFAESGKLYKWVDDKGNMHFTDSPANIPEEYSDQVDIDEIEKVEEKEEDNLEEAESTPAQTAPERPEAQKDEAPRFEVSYEAFEGRADRIIVPVTLNGSVKAKMAVDTGSPGLILSRELANKLDILTGDDGNLVILAAGIGGTVPALRTIIDSINIGGAEDLFIPATVTDSLSDAWEGLVGMDFLTKYAINIDTEKNVIVFTSKKFAGDHPGGHSERWWRNRFKEFAAYKNAWADYIVYLNERSNNRKSLSAKFEFENVLWFAEKQLEEAEKLYFKLNSYATDNMVPMNWREY